ncbi:galactonate dehydratase [Maribellus comscasis]|uniref:Galactonate dehydratase n=1 Tax=Maribellus comscasis TaxID=2681766 RepID=A0A6I6JXF0_9BACT|nr:galactonate dehydratase [Maribellus comscasis]QGY47836.1 galactonate dehydratase [Maribellus comscasis]
MKIKNIEIFKIPPRWLFLKITTESGISGWGEPALEGKTDSVIAAIHDMKQYLIGQNAEEIEHIYNLLTKGSFYRGGVIMMSAVSGIEQALWDIKGKHLNTPVYNLLGGAVREKVRIYGWIGGDSPTDLISQAQRRIDSGYTALKINACGKTEWIVSPSETKSIIQRLKELRAAVGDKIEIGIDFHGRVHKSAVKRLVKELEEFCPMFYEEPLLPEYIDQLKDVANYTTVPIAFGERLVGRREFKSLINNGIVDIIQPDISHTGGIWEIRKIAAMAETSDIALAPHCPLGPIAFAASLHINTCCPNVIIQETSQGIHYNEGTDMLDYIINKKDLSIIDGFIPNLEKPGLGIEIDEKFVKEMSKIGHNWRNPIWYGKDGSLLEW